MCIIGNGVYIWLEYFNTFQGEPFVIFFLLSSAILVSLTFLLSPPHIHSIEQLPNRA